MRVRGRDGASMVTTEAKSVSLIPLSWTKNPQLVKAIYSNCLSHLKQEVIQVLSCFQTMSSHTLITLDQRDDDEVDMYQGKLRGLRGILLLTLAPHLFTYFVFF